MTLDSSTDQSGISRLIGGITLPFWAVMLFASLLPDIVFNELLNMRVPWLIWAKLGLVLLAIGLSFVSDQLKPLRLFAVLLLAVLLLEFGRSELLANATWQGWFGGSEATTTELLLRDQMTRLVAAFLMIGFLLLLGFRPATAYLRAGNLSAPIGRTPLLGFKAGEIKWSRLGPLAALAVGAGTLVFLILGGTPSADFISLVVTILPAVWLFATINAFAEEVIFRAALLAPLRDRVGRTEAIMLTAVYFGLAHYYGVPYGYVGVIMATFLGWLLGKSMVETDGFFWPWFIHFVQDILIFSFVLLSVITPGG